MNVRKPTDYSTLFTALDELMAANLPQMELFSLRRFGLSRIVYNAHIVPYRAALIEYRPVKFRAFHKLLHQICTTILPVNQRKSRGKFHSRNLPRDFLAQIYTTVLPINRR